MSPPLPPTILFTSAGRVSRHVISTLLSLPFRPAIRLFVRNNFPPIDEPWLSQLRSNPHALIPIQSFEGDRFKEAFHDLTMVFHDGPLLDVNEEAMSFSVIDAAKAAGVTHVILCSTFQPFRSKLPANKWRLAVEEYLVESRLNYTILQPGFYMQNVNLPSIINSGKIPMGFSPILQHGFVDLTDLALVVKQIISNPKKHNKGRYELIGENASYDEIARIISEESRSDVRCDVLSVKEYMTCMDGAGFLHNERRQDTVERMMLYFDRWGLDGNTFILEKLLERVPIDWRGHVQRELRHLRN